MHPSHDWHSMAAEGAGYACTRCHVCTCHSPATSARPCEYADPEPDDSST